MDQKRQDRLAAALGEALAARRAEKGLTQDDMAERVGIGSEAVSRIERGVVLPTLPRLFDFAEALDCRVGELIAAGSDRPDDQAAVLSRALAGLSPEDRLTVLAVVGTLAGRLGKPPPRSRH
ncbi:MAG: helix-turn-helix domain-containing protein [Ramlibacter sp.]